MRSSTGVHFVALDHVRASAAFLVFSWHFLHGFTGSPVPFEGAPDIFPLALVDEGHTGVSLFMVLSGFLFAKLLHGKRIRFSAFLWNRVIRLAPLLIVVFALVGLERYFRDGDPADYLRSLPRGFLYPIWPNGGWSIATEIHFYLLLPALLYLARIHRALPLLAVAGGLGCRIYFYCHRGEVQLAAYWTIVGRIDQFAFGIVALLYSREIASRKWIAMGLFLGFSIFYWWFDETGGYTLRPSYPSTSRIWIVLPTLEGIAYSALIVWYDSLSRHADHLVARAVQKLGEYSYSIYLLHYFVVFRAANFIHNHVVDLSNFYVAVVCSAACFSLMLIPGYLSFRFIESPFLRLRRKYLIPDAAIGPTA